MDLLFVFAAVWCYFLLIFVLMFPEEVPEPEYEPCDVCWICGQKAVIASFVHNDIRYLPARTRDVKLMRCRFCLILSQD